MGRPCGCLRGKHSRNGRASTRLQSRLKCPSSEAEGNQGAGGREGARTAAKLRAGINGRAAYMNRAFPFRLLLINSGFYSVRAGRSWGVKSNVLICLAP